MSETTCSAAQKPGLVLEIAVILCCKLTAIFGLWYFFFGPDKRVEQTPENVATALLERAPESNNSTQQITPREQQ